VKIADTRPRYVNAYDITYNLGGNTAPVGDLTPSSMLYSDTLLGNANDGAVLII